MDKELLARLAQKAELTDGASPFGIQGYDFGEELLAFAALVAEECVRLCMRTKNAGGGCDQHDGCDDCADAIRDAFTGAPK